MRPNFEKGLLILEEGYTNDYMHKSHVQTKKAQT